MNASLPKLLLGTASMLLPLAVLLPLALGMIFLSCTGPESEGLESEGSEDSLDAELQFKGVVQYRQIEGGAWVIESTGDNSTPDSSEGDKSISGTTYEPKNLPEAYREEGLRVRVWADRLEGQASIRMAGPIIFIKHIERRQ